MARRQPCAPEKTLPTTPACGRNPGVEAALLCGGVRRHGHRRGEGTCRSVLGAQSPGRKKAFLHDFGEGEGRFRENKGRPVPGEGVPWGKRPTLIGKGKFPWEQGGVRGARASRAHGGARKIRVFGAYGGVCGLPEARVFRNTLFSN